MYILETSACDSLSVLGTILFIKNLIEILSYIVPVILILLVTIDITKAVMANDDSAMKKAQNIAVKRLIAGLIVFFVPIIVDATFKLVDDNGVLDLSCYTSANEETVNALAKAEKEELLQEEADRQALIKASKKSKEALQKEINKLRNKAIANANRNSNSTSLNGDVPNKYIQAKKIAEAAGGGSNCGDGHKTNCPLGDQTGKEVRFSNWRSGWTYIMRPTDPTVANKAASCMEAAVKNKNIGYGQQGYSKWYGLWDYLQKRKDWDVSTVNKKVSVSCCPLVAVCLKYAGYKPSKSLSCYPPPSNMKSAVKNSGKFKEISSRNLTKIRRGDVLISTHHMAMAV